MEPEPEMETGPPALIESIVRLLTPPASREHVLGDLCERYRSPGQYVRDAVRTVPFVLASRIRRTSSAPVLASQAVCVLVNFVDRSMVSVATAIAASATAVAILGLRNAYRVTQPQWPKAPAMDALVAMPVALLVHQVLNVTIGQPFRPMYAFVNATQAFLLLFAAGVLCSPRLVGAPAIGRRVVYILACLTWATVAALVAVVFTGFASGLLFVLMFRVGGSGTNPTLASVTGTLWSLAPVAGALIAVFLCAAFPRWGFVRAGRQ